MMFLYPPYLPRSSSEIYFCEVFPNYWPVSTVSRTSLSRFHYSHLTGEDVMRPVDKSILIKS
jgi:hypothetical protein